MADFNVVSLNLYGSQGALYACLSPRCGSLSPCYGYGLSPQYATLTQEAIGLTTPIRDSLSPVRNSESSFGD